MADEHIDALLSDTSPEEEFADEVAAYEKEEKAAEKAAAKKAAPVDDEPEADDEPDLEAKDDEADEEADETEKPADDEQPEVKADKADAEKQGTIKALQAIRSENQQLKQQYNQLTAYMQQLQQAQQPQEQETIPDPDENPIEALQWLMKSQQQTAQQQQQAQQQTQQMQYVDQVKQNYASAAKQYEAQQPDFKDAYAHLIKSRVEELELNGLDMDRIRQQLDNEELGFAIEAINSGVNPAERLYKMAMVRGYRPASKPNPVAQERPSAELEEAKRAAATNTNRSAPPGRKMTLEEIGDLDGAAFDKALARWEKENGLSEKRFV